MQNTDEMDKKQRTVTKIQDDLPSCHKIFFHLQINLKLLTKRHRKLQPYKPQHNATTHLHNAENTLFKMMA